MTASAMLSDIQMSSRLVLSTTYPQGFKALRPAICPESQLSRELGAPLYSVQLGTRKTKPQLLYPLVLAELQRAAPRLQAVCGRENGQLYFSTDPLSFASGSQLLWHLGVGLGGEWHGKTVSIVETIFLAPPKSNSRNVLRRSCFARYGSNGLDQDPAT